MIDLHQPVEAASQGAIREVSGNWGIGRWPSRCRGPAAMSAKGIGVSPHPPRGQRSNHAAFRQRLRRSLRYLSAPSGRSGWSARVRPLGSNGDWRYVRARCVGSLARCSLSAHRPSRSPAVRRPCARLLQQGGLTRRRNRRSSPRSTKSARGGPEPVRIQTSPMRISLPEPHRSNA